jgi:hypothetical protein
MPTPTTPRMRKANEKNAKVSLPSFLFPVKTWLKAVFLRWFDEFFTTFFSSL